MKSTDFRLFHNHMTIESVCYHGSKTTKRLREVIFEEFADSDNDALYLIKNLIFLAQYDILTRYI